MSAPSTDPIPFDQAMAQLESLLTELDSGDLGLEASVEKYAEGVELMKKLQDSFGITEERVQTLTDALRQSLADLEEGAEEDDDDHPD